MDNRPEAGALGERPEVSVVIPVYRNRETLKALLERLDDALSGERREYVLVVDGWEGADAAKDEILASVKRFQDSPDELAF